MLSYTALNLEDITYTKIERFVSTVKCHRSVTDQDWEFVQGVWNESIRVKKGEFTDVCGIRM